MFDWQRFLQRHKIEYVTRGPNVARGRIAIRCPWCGEADPSQHLWISLRHAAWGCWRNRNHSGQIRSRLIQRLLQCSVEEAKALAEEETVTTPVDTDLGKQVAGLLGVNREAPVTDLWFPTEFKPLERGKRPLASSQFWNYLRKRGYNEEDRIWVAKQYRLHFALRGIYGYRLIIPICMRDGKLASWTGRAINPEAEVRYRSLPKALSVEVPTNLVLGIEWLKDLSNVKLLVVCEGPFDAIRVSAIGHDYGVYGTCLFGLNASRAQATLLQELSRVFSRVGLLLDADAQMAVLRILDRLAIINVAVLKLPPEVKDAGELTDVMAEEVVQSWLQPRRAGYELTGDVV